VDSIKGTTRIVAVGSSVFLNNNWIDASFGNRDFAVLAVNWLLDRAQLMKGVGPRAIVEYQLNLSDIQINLLMWIMMAIVPGCILGIGLIVWARRRNSLWNIHEDGINVGIDWVGCCSGRGCVLVR
jgi:ABC-type uncharacterized transport system involved in gliding motility auxiliary subunit